LKFEIAKKTIHLSFVPAQFFRPTNQNNLR
jgi:hypothetical protein